MLSWRVGDVTITRILEQEGPRPLLLFPEASEAAIREHPWMVPHFADKNGNIFGSVHALVVETPTRRIVVDTCCGNEKTRVDAPQMHMLRTTFLRDLEAAGFARESIDTVLCTHLHVDHVGWNTMLVDGHWAPTFPKARYLIAREEYDSWRDGNRGMDEVIFADSIEPVFAAGLVDLIEVDAKICDEIKLVPTPGHTKGHVSVSIESRGEKALITGDFMHHPCQLARPEWSTIFDYNQDTARETRHRLFASLAGTPTLVIGTHFSTPTAGRIVRDGASYRLDCDAGKS